MNGGKGGGGGGGALNHLPLLFCKSVYFRSTDDIIILLNFIFTCLHGYQITPGLSTNKERHCLSLLKTGIHVAQTHLQVMLSFGNILTN